MIGPDLHSNSREVAFSEMCPLLGAHFLGLSGRLFPSVDRLRGIDAK